VGVSESWVVGRRSSWGVVLRPGCVFPNINISDFACSEENLISPDDDDKFTPYETPNTPSHHSSSQPATAHTETETPLLHQKAKRRVGPVDGPPQPIWLIVGPPKLAPEGGPGPGGQSKGT